MLIEINMQSPFFPLENLYDASVCSDGVNTYFVGRNKELICYNSQQDSWGKLADMPLSPLLASRSSSGSEQIEESTNEVRAVLLYGQIYCFYSSHIQRYDIATNSWSIGAEIPIFGQDPDSYFTVAAAANEDNPEIYLIGTTSTHPDQLVCHIYHTNEGGFLDGERWGNFPGKPSKYKLIVAEGRYLVASDIHGSEGGIYIRDTWYENTIQADSYNPLITHSDLKEVRDLKCIVKDAGMYFGKEGAGIRIYASCHYVGISHDNSSKEYYEPLYLIYDTTSMNVSQNWTPVENLQGLSQFTVVCQPSRVLFISGNKQDYTEYSSKIYELTNRGGKWLFSHYGVPFQGLNVIATTLQDRLYCFFGIEPTENNQPKLKPIYNANLLVDLDRVNDYKQAMRAALIELTGVYLISLHEMGWGTWSSNFYLAIDKNGHTYVKEFKGTTNFYEEFKSGSFTPFYDVFFDNFTKIFYWMGKDPMYADNYDRRLSVKLPLNVSDILQGPRINGYLQYEVIKVSNNLSDNLKKRSILKSDYEYHQIEQDKFDRTFGIKLFVADVARAGYDGEVSIQLRCKSMVNSQALNYTMSLKLRRDSFERDKDYSECQSASIDAPQPSSTALATREITDLRIRTHRSTWFDVLKLKPQIDIQDLLCNKSYRFVFDANAEPDLFFGGTHYYEVPTEEFANCELKIKSGYPVVNQLSHWLPTHFKYNEVCYLTTHNAMANPEDAPNTPVGGAFANQSCSISKQLEYGADALMIDIYPYIKNNTTTIVMSHSTPNANSPLFENGLNAVVNHLRNNPYSVITLFLENYIEAKDASLLMDVFKKTRADTYLFDPRNLPTNPNGWGDVITQGWPSLEWMKQHNRRLVVFSQFQRGQYPDLPSVWDFVKENVYGSGFASSVESSLDPNTWTKLRPECVTRNLPVTTNTLSLMNHFYSVPALNLDLFNAQLNSVYEHAQAMKDARDANGNLIYTHSSSQRHPNFIATDYSVGYKVKSDPDDRGVLENRVLNAVYKINHDRGIMFMFKKREEPDNLEHRTVLPLTIGVLQSRDRVVIESSTLGEKELKANKVNPESSSYRQTDTKYALFSRTKPETLKTEKSSQETKEQENINITPKSTY